MIFYGWIVVACTFTVMLMTYGAQYSFGVFFSAMLDELGWSRAELAGAFSLYSFVYISLSFATGRLTDRLGPKRVIALGGCFLGGGMILVNFIESPWQLYLTYGLIAGMGMSAAYVPCNVTVVKWFSRHRGVAIGLTGSGASIGIAGFPVLSDALITRFGWRLTYLVFGLSVLVVLNIAAWFLVRDPETLGLSPDGRNGDAPESPMTPSPAERSWTLGEALRSTRFWLLASVMILSLLTIPSAFVHLPQHARDLQLDVSRSTLIMIIGLFALLGNLVLGRLSDTIGRRGAMLGSLIVGTLVFGGFTVVRSASGLYVAAAGFGFYYGTFASLYPAVVGDYFGRLHAGTLTGFCFAMGSLSSALGPALMGVVADLTGQYHLAFLSGTVINAIVVCLFLLVTSPYHPLSSAPTTTTSG